MRIKYFQFFVLIWLKLFIDCTEGDVRLVGGAHKFQGTVEICLDSSWCLVSQHGWDNRDARTVCRELGGYNPSGKFTTNNVHLYSFFLQSSFSYNSIMLWQFILNTNGKSW